MKQIREYEDILQKKKGERQRLIGRQDGLIDELKKEGFDTVEEADEELLVIDEKIKKLEGSLKTLQTEFEEQYGGFLNG